MPTPLRRQQIGVASSVALFVALGLVYGATLAPGLTWANRGADGGDLIAAAATSGVAHPPGYPTYLALARLFQLLPFGSLAFRTNLFSAICAALAAVLVADVVTRSTGQPSRLSRAAGLIAGFAFGTSPLVWSQAVITEVYALHALLTALILRLTMLDAGAPADHRTGRGLLEGVLLGLSLGNHMTTALLLPPWLAGAAVTKADRKASTGRSAESGVPGWRIRWHSVIVRLGGLVAGSLIYLTLPVRAASLSPVNWGNAATWSGFWWLVSGQVYQERVFGLPAAQILPRLEAWAGLLIAQYGLPGLAVMLYGWFFGRAAGSRLFWMSMWMMAAFSLFAIGYNSPDSYAYLIPAVISAAIGLGWGIELLLEAIARRARWSLALAGAGMLLLLFLHASLTLPQVDASQDRRAEAFGRAVMGTAPASALLFTAGDEETFALWYFHFALGQRPDVVVVNEPLLAFDWYRQTLQRTYPALVVPGQAAAWRPSLVEANHLPECDARRDVPGALTCIPSPPGLR